jgi:lipid II:glycine glycyltransferase (peptidoglycan interpeptide bridge formation enzyme)
MIDEASWRAFVTRHPQGNIFHTPDMFEVFQRARGFQPQLRAVVDDGGQVLALLLPVHVTLSDGLISRLTTRVIVYGSVLCTPGQAGQEALDALLRNYSQEHGQKALFTELRNLADLSALQPVLNAHGFVHEDHLDYLIDLNRTPEQLMQNIGPRTRKHIRRALRDGAVTVEEIHDRGLITTAYNLIAKSFAAARVPLADRSLFEAAFDILQPRGMAKFLMARVGDTWVATSAELPFKDVIYGWYSGIDRAYGDSMAGEMLMWHILKWGAESSYKTYDFGGAGKPGEEYAVRNFKAKFGGQLVCFGRYKKVHAPTLLRYSKLGYGLYRNFIRLSQSISRD